MCCLRDTLKRQPTLPIEDRNVILESPLVGTGDRDQICLLIFEP